MRRKIKIKNETAWRTDHIRRFIIRCANDVLTDNRELSILVIYRKGLEPKDQSAGYAWYNSGAVVLKLPRGDQIDKVQFAKLVGHELGHCRGIRHRAMKGNPAFSYQGDYRRYYAWANDLPLEKRRQKSSRRPVGINLAIKRLQDTEAKLQEWNGKKRRAEKAIRKYRQKAGYYQKRVDHFRAAESPDLRDHQIDP